MIQNVDNFTISTINICESVSVIKKKAGGGGANNMNAKHARA